MEHPRPAFDLLTSLPVDARVDESVFIDWFAFVDAEKGDDIENHPEIWKEWELPVALSELSTDDFVSSQPFGGEVNLNALAIGLGLEEVKYEPEVFGGIVYEPTDYEATVFIFWRGIIFSVGGTRDSTTEALEHTLDRLEMLDLDDDASFEADMQTGRVSDYI
ncbi:hypothetical protein [Halorubrum distributum]|uniref:hypothetical protein n=1 Tax=Halorubrum distributum TaxID=29283 RepID=UPI001375EE16|nr:hypothetical protein [Halorubrum arcis]